MTLAGDVRGSLDARVRQALDALNGDEEFRAAGEPLDFVLALQCEPGASIGIRVARGTASAIPIEGQRADVTLRAPASTWDEALARYPSPGFQSITALQRCRNEFAVDADPLLLAQCLHCLERIIEVVRGDTGADGPARSTVARDAGLIEGRYADIDAASGRRARIYWERSGDGAPVVMLHTAGADSRQFHDLLSDVELARDWSLHAFDLPAHGRSMPVFGEEGKPWHLSQDEYADWCVSFIRQVIGGPAIVIGCSMGAAIAVVLAARHPSWVQAVIAVEAPDRSPGRKNPFLRHAKVNQAEYAASYVRGLMSPRSPAQKRRLACWIYSQGGFGVYHADLGFYSDEYDGLRVAPDIDTRRTPLYLLTGEYDYSATPASTERLAAAIPGARFMLMHGLGHFPMTENPDAFRAYLVPVLASLRSRHCKT
jgi:pimeloyl-ACP methyl ester carboxylesterase